MTSPAPAPVLSTPGSPFAHRDYAVFQASRFCVTVAIQMQGLAVGYHVYRLTGRALDLAFVGLAQFLPAFVLSLVTGHVADRFDRRRVLAVAGLVQVLVSAALAAIAWTRWGGTPAIYAALVLGGTARAFAGPAGSALMPTLVPGPVMPRAIAWSSTIWQIATIAGPALGGLVYGLGDSPTAVYVACLGTELVSTAGFLAVRPRAQAARGGAATLDALLAGVRYVRSKPVLLGAISLDLFAVLLGGAVALLPVFADAVLEVGVNGLAWMRSMPAVGAACMALLLSTRPIASRAGTWMFAGVAVFGLATIVFGLSRDYWLSLGALFVIGASDMVSVYVRQTLIQLRTPDEMRGRVSAVNLVFVGASNELGEFESGLVATFFGDGPTGAIRAVVVGGLGTLGVVALWARLFPALRKADRLDLGG
jgi:MFS family permease